MLRSRYKVAGHSLSEAIFRQICVTNISLLPGLLDCPRWSGQSWDLFEQLRPARGLARAGRSCYGLKLSRCIDSA